MKIAIIGGSGFIGSYTYVELINAGFDDVTIIDIIPPYRPNVLCKEPRFIKCDITNCKATDHILKREQYNIIYLLAGVIRAEEVKNDPSGSYLVNITGLVNVLESVKHQNNFYKFIYSSTTHLFHKENKFVDDYTPVNTDDMHLYPGGKACAETIIKGYQTLFDIPYIIFRYSVACGIYGHKDGVVHKFIDLAKSGDDLKVHSKGTVWRDLLYVKNHAVGNMLAAQNIDVKNETILLGGTCINLIDLADKICKMTESKSKIIPVDFKRKGDHCGFKSIYSGKARNILGWNMSVSLDEGIAAMIKYDT